MNSYYAVFLGIKIVGFVENIDGDGIFLQAIGAARNGFLHNEGKEFFQDCRFSKMWITINLLKLLFHGFNMKEGFRFGMTWRFHNSLVLGYNRVLMVFWLRL